ncbi:MAG TPA: hypothetical protein VMV25_03850 [Steroidobacteraceae bacterium]|nr:hypothetical protein [Steroidobacteraceae bacterium]
MSERRFADLAEALLRNGVAAKRVRRAVIEIEDHYRQLVDDALARGKTLTDARNDAHALLGSDQVLIDRFSGQVELRAWWSRRTRFCFGLAPLLSYVALSVTTMAILMLIARHMDPYLHRVHVPLGISRRIGLAVRVIFLWIFPVLVAAAYALIAYRQRIRLRWPVAGILFLCGFAALVNVDMVITGGSSPGEANGGIGVSGASWPAQAARAIATAMVVLGPLWLAVRRSRRGGSVID